MPLEQGTHLGQYEVLSSLGAGGMGEVYRARDLKLGREVALKLLLDEVSTDPERLLRFEREARVLASLNHPNIATLHGFETEGDTSFLVMELVEGETLAERIARGPIPADEAIALFLQISEGLEAAHEKGVVHRDLKPANIKLGADGSGPKILDFGLAKALAPETDSSENPSISMSPTLTLAATQRGEILGTAAYMSPEQASGKMVDRRTDVWAFGVCLFEALTGRRAFRGEDAPNTLAAVLRDELDFAALPKTCPQSIPRLLERCLVRDRRDRLHDIADARLELQAALTEPANSATGTTRTSASVWLVGAATGAIGLLLGALGLGLFSDEAQQTERPPTHVRAMRLDYPNEMNPSLDISPDGRHLVHVLLNRGRPSLFLQSLDGDGDFRALEGTDFAANPFFSPDGDWVGFVKTTDNWLRKVSLAGGSPVEIAGSVDGFNLRGGGWSAEGAIYYSPLFDGIWKVSDEGGEAERVTEPARDGFEMAHWWPFTLPGDRGLLFSTCCTGSKVMALDFESGMTKVVVENATVPRYTRSGHLLFIRGSRLMAATFDLETLAAGPERSVTEGIAIGDDRHADYTISQNGTLAYLSGTSALERRLARIDTATGERVLIDREAAPYSLWHRLDPSAGRVALTLWDEKQADVFLYDMERGGIDRVTDHPTNDFWPVFDHDSNGLTFTSMRNGRFDLWHQRLDTNEPAKLLITNEHSKWASSRSPENDLLFTQFELETKHDIWILDSGQSDPRPVVQTPFTEGDGVHSPDGRWFAYNSDRSGQMEIYVQSLSDSARDCRISTGGGQRPKWPMSDTLFYARGDTDALGDTAVAARFNPADPCQATTEDLFDGLDEFWDVSADGSFFVTLEPREQPVLNLVFDFFTELERLVPTH